MGLLVQHFLRRSARLFPDAIAIDDGVSLLNYRQLAEQVDRCLLNLSNRGIKAGQRVVIFSANNADYVTAYFACAHIGAVLVPMNIYLKASEIDWILADCDPVAVIADEENIERLSRECAEAIGARIPLSLGKGVPGWTPLAAPVADEFQPDDRVGACFAPGAVAHPDDIVVQMYTSGTTGTPKGVLLSHYNVTSVVGAWLHEMPMTSAKSRFMQATPLFHVGGMLICFCTVASGSALILLPKFETRLALDTLLNRSISHTLLVPSMIQQLLMHPKTGDEAFPNLEVIAYGASSIPQTVLRQAMEFFDCGFLQGYGLTETAGVALSLRPADHCFAEDGSPPEKLRAAGRELLSCEVRVVDDNFNDVEVNVAGEIVVRGANVMSGYWNNPEATSKALINGWLKTGDIGVRDEEGYIYVVDRLKDMIIVSGENVYPAEVENVLARHPTVAEAAVIGLPNLLLGEEVVAVIVIKPDSVDAVESGKTRKSSFTRELRAHCNNHLASFKCPFRYKFIDSLPRTPAGKIQKQVLRDRFAAN